MICQIRRQRNIRSRLSSSKMMQRRRRLLIRAPPLFHYNSDLAITSAFSDVRYARRVTYFSHIDD